MSFTKEEAINLLGKTVEITQTIYFELDLEQRFPKIEKGTIAEVYLVENDPNEIIISLLVYEQYEPFNKVQFEKYCQIINPEPVYHVRSV